MKKDAIDVCPNCKGCQGKDDYRASNLYVVQNFWVQGAANDDFHECDENGAAVHNRNRQEVHNEKRYANKRRKVCDVVNAL